MIGIYREHNRSKEEGKVSSSWEVTSELRCERGVGVHPTDRAGKAGRGEQLGPKPKEIQEVFGGTANHLTVSFPQERSKMGSRAALRVSLVDGVEC